jgi:hypothetical protein
MAVELTWMPPHAPYMPIATAGLLAALEEHGHRARAQWEGEGDEAILCVDSPLDADGIAAVLADAPWPSLELIDWPDGKHGQGLKPTLKGLQRPAEEFRRLVKTSPPLEAALLRAILTDGVLDGEGLPGRSRLLRGVKADLSCVENCPKRVTAAGLATELREGPEFRSGQSGLGLGLVPEVQTFGGTTGPEASTVGAHSPLLYLLLWRGIMALAPVAVVRGRYRAVGGPLVTAPDVLSWPLWRIPVGLRSLRTLFVLDAIHSEPSDREQRAENSAYLHARGIDAVYRSRAVALNSMVAVFGWGERVLV